MDLIDDAVPLRRRRGKELEDALLDAAWAELVAVGYAAFTIDAVAERAHTSRPVLYRRWPNRDDLVIAAIRHSSAQEAEPLPDTGSLRGDVIAFLSSLSESRTSFQAAISALLGACYQQTGKTPAQLREQLIEGRTSSIETILQRAVDRGEVDPDRLTPRLTTLAIDLLRHEFLMSFQPVPEETILEIVDDIFLPLVLTK